MPSICDNLFAPDRDNPDIDDLVVMQARIQMGLPTPTGYGRAVINFSDNHGYWLLTWVLDHVRTLVDERYEDDPFMFGRWDCEVNSRCYCAYARAGLSPLDHMLVHEDEGITFLNPRTREIFDEHGTVIGHDTSGVLA